MNLFAENIWWSLQRLDIGLGVGEVGEKEQQGGMALFTATRRKGTKNKKKRRAREGGRERRVPTVPCAGQQASLQRTLSSNKS